MLVSDRRYAAQAVLQGERRYFDDVGCYVLWNEEHHSKAERAWVRDAEGSAWLDARSAKYVAGARTPMDFGFEGRRPADPNGVGFEELRAAILARRDRERSSR